MTGWGDDGDESFALTVDLVLLTIVGSELCVLAVRRDEAPFAGSWALPGGAVHVDEDLDQATARVFGRRTGLVLPHVEQLGTFAAVGRDPRRRAVSVAHLAFLPVGATPATTTDTAPRRFFALGADGRCEGVRLAFDHDRIVAEGAERGRAKLEYTTLATSFLGDEFTLGDLRRVYEAAWSEMLHHGNFVRKVRATPGFVIPTGRRRRAAGGPELFQAGPAQVMMPPLMRRTDGAEEPV